MTAESLCYNRRVIWRGLNAVICDIRPGPHGTAVQIQVAGGHRHWTTADELEVAT